METPSPLEPDVFSVLIEMPSLESLPRAADGFDPDAVAAAFSAYRRQLAQVSAQLRVLQSARPAQGQGTGHAVRLDALHLIRQAAEFADVLERDAQEATTRATEQARADLRGREQALERREAEVASWKEDAERQSALVIQEARSEARRLLDESQHQSRSEILLAEQKARDLIESARHQAAELVDSARTEVSLTLDWARKRSHRVIERGQQAAADFLTSAGMPLADAEIRAVELLDDVDGN